VIYPLQEEIASSFLSLFTSAKTAPEQTVVVTFVGELPAKPKRMPTVPEGEEL
jgi:hypothetical protein